MAEEEQVHLPSPGRLSRSQLPQLVLGGEDRRGGEGSTAGLGNLASISASRWPSACTQSLSSVRLPTASSRAECRRWAENGRGPGQRLACASPPSHSQPTYTILMAQGL